MRIRMLSQAAGAYGVFNRQQVYEVPDQVDSKLARIFLKHNAAEIVEGDLGEVEENALKPDAGTENALARRKGKRKTAPRKSK